MKQLEYLLHLYSAKRTLLREKAKRKSDRKSTRWTGIDSVESVRPTAVLTVAFTSSRSHVANAVFETAALAKIPWTHFREDVLCKTQQQ